MQESNSETELYSIFRRHLRTNLICIPLIPLTLLASVYLARKAPFPVVLFVLAAGALVMGRVNRSSRILQSYLLLLMRDRSDSENEMNLARLDKDIYRFYISLGLLLGCIFAWCYLSIHLYLLASYIAIAVGILSLVSLAAVSENVVEAHMRAIQLAGIKRRDTSFLKITPNEAKKLAKSDVILPLFIFLIWSSYFFIAQKR